MPGSVDPGAKDVYEEAMHFSGGKSLPKSQTDRRFGSILRI